MEKYPNIAYKRGGCNPCNKGKEYPKISYRPSFLREANPESRFKPDEIVNYKGERVRILEHIGDRVQIFIPSRQEEVWVKAENLEREVGKVAPVTPEVTVKDSQLVTSQAKTMKTQIEQALSGAGIDPTGIRFSVSTRHKYPQAVGNEVLIPAELMDDIELFVGNIAHEAKHVEMTLSGKAFDMTEEAIEAVAEKARLDAVAGIAKPAIPKAESNPDAYPEVRYKPSYLKETEKPILYEARLWRKWANMDDVIRPFATEQEAYDYLTHLKYIAKVGDKITIKRSQEWDIKVLHRETIDKEGQFWTIRKPYEPIPTEPIRGASYLKEATAVDETECQLIPPEYYDLLGWLGASAPEYSFAIEPGTRERKLTETLQKLKEGVARIHESALFRDFLLVMSKFHYYSIYNQMLIALQRPTATRVAGYVTWQDLGRQVKAGERGIAILAPCLPPRILKCPLCEKTFPERELRTHIVEVHQREDVSILVREAREEAEAVMQPTVTYFKVVNVFDIAQTVGEPLPEIEVPTLTGAYSEELYNKLMGLAGKHSVTVSFEPKPGLDPAIKGTLLEKSIWVKPDETEAQKLKTLGHELAHYFTEAVFFIPRADAEVIAEGVAFVVCAHFGFDSGIRSFPYVALWAKDKKVLEQNTASIRKIAGRIIDEVEV